ncbi:hypothetical protein [Rhodoferax saidenbachensis]|uniref:Uncharacterized protein n=1 Tax=Rhodoferax saidenbachensis TaxID=1484693 RepID=A0ABU1ZQ61_9BURK|nr:hypothetical protein [Rhodoferax saidenbachensis]MDR7307697.1 hypothetical protein [Rhodoferax saidenbachensis]
MGASLTLMNLLCACGGGGGSDAGSSSGGSASAPLSAPSISAVTGTLLHQQTITVQGSHFGSKPQAAPLRFEDFDTRSTGTAPASFGYTNYGGFGGSTTVDGTEAYGNGKSLKHQSHFGAVSSSGVVEESFPHIATTGFSATELYLSYRLKFRTNGGRIVQLKFNRSGMEVAGANGSPCYGGKPKYYSSYYPDGPSVNRYSTDKRLVGVQGGIVRSDGSLDEGWVGEDAGMGSGTVLALEEDTWVQVEEYYRLNDIGQTNGEHITWVNGNLQIDRHALQPRTSAAQVLNCSYLAVGMDYWINPSSTDGVSVWYDDHYLDTSRARLVLANAATWSAATLRNPQVATQWQDGSISATLQRGGFSAGPAWLYVVRADGSTSTGWPVTLP